MEQLLSLIENIDGKLHIDWTADDTSGVLNARVYSNPNISGSPVYQDFSFNFFAKQIELEPIIYSANDKYQDAPDQFISKYLNNTRTIFFQKAIS
jgi:hypothetical protein